MARRKKGRAVTGWLNFDKPYGMGSTTAVGKLRRLFDAQKAGHAGTLDPLADGILPIALGEATKTVSFLQDAAKSYHFTLAFGQATNTDDKEGEVISTSHERPDTAAIAAALPHFTGTVMQVPPQFSAIRKDGVRAYAAARAGEKIDLAARAVRIDAVSIVERPDAGHVSLSVDCGKGTYIRALARDLAVHLGSVGHVTALRRTRVGPFDEKTALGLDKLTALGHYAPDLAALDACLSPLKTVLDDIPALAIDADAASRMMQGQAISPPAAGLVAGTVYVHCQDRPIAIGQSDGVSVRPLRVFNL